MAVNILNPGESLQGYVVEKVLGVGGFGVVYLVHAAADPSRRFAIKLLQPRQDRREESIARQAFLNEITNMGALCQQESGIVTIYNSIIHTTPAGVQLGVVMEFVQGEPLYDVIQKQGKMVHERAIPVLMLVLKTLGFAHRQGIIHRDIKPENIMVLTGNTLQAGTLTTHPIKILDFGLSKAFEGEVTTESTGWGSSIYMPPERIRGAGERINVTTDIYSAGVMAYVMLTGRYPFDIGGKDPFTALRIISTSTVPSIRESYEFHPTGLDPAIAKAMARDPAARYQSCKEMAEALAQFLPGSLALFRGEYNTELPPAGAPVPPPRPTPSVPEDTSQQKVRSTPPPGTMPEQPKRVASTPSQGTTPALQSTSWASAILSDESVAPQKYPAWLVPTIVALLVLGIAGFWIAKVHNEDTKRTEELQIDREKAAARAAEQMQKVREDAEADAKAAASQKAKEDTEQATKTAQIKKVQAEKIKVCEELSKSIGIITKDEMKELEANANLGDPHAQDIAGSIYWCGAGSIRQSSKNAKMWFNKLKNNRNINAEGRIKIQQILDQINLEKGKEVTP